MNRKFLIGSWFRTVTFVVLATFLWTNLSLGSPSSHLRPQPSSQDGGVKELRASLSENPAEKAHRGLRRQLFRVALLGLLMAPHFAVPSIASSELPPSPSQVQTIETEVSENVQAYHAKQRAFLESKEKYEASLRSYLEKLELWSESLSDIQQGKHMAAFDEAMLRAVETLKGVLRTQLEAIDKVIAENVLPPGSLHDVASEEFLSLIQEDPQVGGEFFIPPDILNQASFSVAAVSDADLSASVSVEGVVTFTAARLPNGHVIQYEVPTTASVQHAGQVVFSFDIAKVIREGHLLKRVIDTDGVVLSSHAASRIDEAPVAGVTFQALRNGVSLLSQGTPVSLGRHFTVADGVIRPGSFQVLSHTMNGLSDTPTAEEVNRHSFEFTLGYASDPVLAPLPQAYGILEMTFSEVRRPSHSFVVSVPMNRLLSRGESGTFSIRLSENRIVEVLNGQQIGTVSEIAPGPYTVSVSLNDIDADPYPDTQFNDRLARATRAGTVHVGSLQIAGADTLSTEGNWRVDGSAIYTEENGSVDYEVDFRDVSSARTIVMYARNRTQGPLPAGARFDIDVYRNGLLAGRIRVPIDSTGAVRTSGIPVEAFSGVQRFRFKWVNDFGPATTLEIHKIYFLRPSVPSAETFSRSLFASAEENVGVIPTGSPLTDRLETELSRVSESQRFIIEGLSKYMGAGRELSRAESEVATAAAKMNEAASALRAVPNQDTTLIPQDAIVTGEWLRKNREERRRAYGSAYARFLNLEGPEDLLYRIQYGRPWGSSNLSFFVEDRIRVPYLSPKTEEGEISHQYEETSKALTDVQKQLQGATDPVEIARLVDQERTLRKQLVSLEDRSAVLKNAKELLRLDKHLFFGFGWDRLPDGNLSDSTFALSVRGKFGSPFEKTGNGYRFGMPPSEFSGAGALWYRDMFEMGYAAALSLDPGLWTLFSDYVQAHAIFAERLRLGIEHGWIYFRSSFDEYLKTVQAREAVLRALDERGISTSLALEKIFTRGSLSYSWDHLSLGLVAGEGYYEGRLQGSLHGYMLNIAAAREHLDLRMSRRFGDMDLQASVGRDRGEWKLSGGIQTRWGNTPSGRKMAPSGPQISPSLGGWGSLQDPGGMLEGTGVRMRTGEPLEWSGPKLPANPISGVRKAISSPSTSSDPNEIRVDSAIAKLQQGNLSRLFISKMRLLDPTTRRLVGLIQNKVELGTVVQVSSASDELTAERLVKLYALLAHRFQGGEGIKTVHLPVEFRLDQLEKIDDVPLGNIDASTVPDLMPRVFPNEQLEELNREVKVIQTQV